MAFRRTAIIIFAVITVAAGTETRSTLASTLPTYKTWTSIGCQRDSVQGRVLKHLVTLSNTTVEACLDACVVDNYALAGLEDGHECFCGNSILYDYPQLPTCTFPCAGNGSELCGGPESISLYQNAGKPFTIGNASVIETLGLWGFRGCVEEEEGHLLPHGPKVSIPAEQMSIERCTDGCAAASFNAAGLERGQECWCGNISTEEWPSGWETTGLFECNLPCLGNATEFCGGTLAGGRFVAYTSFPELAGAPPGWLQQGCWEDDVASNGGMHLLPRAPNVTIPSGEMTVEKCVAACTNFPGYNTSAGLTAGDECWCGDYSVTPSVPAPCGTRCTGNGREICGGDSSMAIYSNPVTALQQYFTFFGNWSLQGCFVDEAWLTGGPHLLPTKTPIIPDELHARRCMDSCAGLTYTSAGVEVGNECWCGNITYTVAPGVMTPMSECNSRCTDDSFESCGGVNRLQLYKFDSKF